MITARGGGGGDEPGRNGGGGEDRQGHGGGAGLSPSRAEGLGGGMT